MLGEHIDTKPLADFTANLKPQDDDRRTAALRHVLDTAVILRPASTSARDSETLHGRSRDLSGTGCGLVASRAPRVGDIYRIETPKAPNHPLNSVNARCVRCHLLDEDAFDAGFAFFAPLNLETESATSPQWNRDEPLV